MIVVFLRLSRLRLRRVRRKRQNEGCSELVVDSRRGDSMACRAKDDVRWILSEEVLPIKLPRNLLHPLDKVHIRQKAYRLGLLLPHETHICAEVPVHQRLQQQQLEKRREVRRELSRSESTTCDSS